MQGVNTSTYVLAIGLCGLYGLAVQIQHDGSIGVDGGLGVIVHVLCQVVVTGVDGQAGGGSPSHEGLGLTITANGVTVGIGVSGMIASIFG